MPFVLVGLFLAWMGEFFGFDETVIRYATNITNNDISLMGYYGICVLFMVLISSSFASITFPSVVIYVVWLASLFGGAEHLVLGMGGGEEGNEFGWNAYFLLLTLFSIVLWFIEWGMRND